ncbi:hypothetical protein [Motilimonas pumila]|uniref:Uncharacterized protein n=1 Tax=Motilimonas pumila TaxID=2303987 RepID=A0A418YK19_9GAMM|nr:hypothetical protein [Motilimonas pumila]RJG51313.1 hypothetical protein D1Z90_00850 [Motilimonas pumila]
MKRVGYSAFVLLMALALAYFSTPWVAKALPLLAVDLSAHLPLLVSMLLMLCLALVICLFINQYLMQHSFQRSVALMQQAWQKQDERCIDAPPELQSFYQQAWQSVNNSQSQQIALKQKLKQVESHYQAEQQSQRFLLQEKTQEAASSQQEVQILQNRLVKMQHYRSQMNYFEQELNHLRHQLTQYVYLPMQSWTTKLEQIQQECRSPLLATQLRLLCSELEDAQNLAYMLGFLSEQDSNSQHLPKQQVDLAYVCRKTIAMSGRAVALNILFSADTNIKVKAPVLHQALLLLLRSFPNKAKGSIIELTVKKLASSLIFSLSMPDFLSLVHSQHYQEHSYKPQSPHIKQAQQLVSQLPGQLTFQQLDDAIIRCEFDCEIHHNVSLKDHGVSCQLQRLQSAGLNKVMLISKQTQAEYAPQFAGLGIELTCVTSVDQALTLLAQQAIKVVLVSAAENASSVIKQLVAGFSAVEAEPAPSIILLKEGLNQRQMLEYLQLGCDDFMTLPLQQKEVLRVFERVQQQPASEDSWQLFNLLLQSQLNHSSAAQLVALAEPGLRLSLAQRQQLKVHCTRVKDGDNLTSAARELARFSQGLGLGMMASLATEICQQEQSSVNVAGLQILLWQAYQETLSLLDKRVSTIEK